MVELMEQKPGGLESFVQLAAARGGELPEWLWSIREDALARFVKLGFPTTRDEEWRFTNVAPIARTTFALPDDATVDLAPEQLERFAIANLTGPRLTFINGRFSPALSSLDALPRNVQVLPLAQAFQKHRELIEPHLHGHVLHRDRADAFTWLNAAFADDGAFIRVPRGVVIEQPIELLSIAVGANGVPLMMNARNIIVAEESAQFTVVERYVSVDNSVYFTNAVTDMQLGENAVVEHYLLEEESIEAFNISTLRIRQASNSNCASHTVLLGGRLVRNNVHPILDGQPTECLINGLYVGSGSPSGGQHMDNHMRVEHVKPHGDSRQFYHGILDGNASAVFSGRIVVHPDAQKTDAKQTNRNLLLSDDAHVDTKPQLEIYADDVKCTHGATIGQLNEHAIFYLQARGLSKDAARSLLIHAFAGESLERMKLEPIRAYLDRLLINRLPGGELLEHMLEG